MRRNHVLRTASLGAAALAACFSMAGCAQAPGESNGCTGEGQYSVATSAVGPVPGLPESTLGAGHTPSVGLMGTREDGTAPTVSLLVWADEPEPSHDETFKDLSVGDQLTFRGYTLKVTSICPSHAQFDLLLQEEPTD